MIQIAVDCDDINKILVGLGVAETQIRVVGIDAGEGIGLMIDAGALSGRAVGRLIPAVKCHIRIADVQPEAVVLEVHRLGAVNRWIPDWVIRTLAETLLQLPWLKKHTVGENPIGGFLRFDSVSRITLLVEPLLRQLNLPLHFTPCQIVLLPGKLELQLALG